MEITKFLDDLMAGTDALQEFVRPSKEMEKRYLNFTKSCYDFMKKEEKNLGILQTKSSLQSLFINGMDVEQIYQQIELQSISVLTPMVTSSLDENNLCYLVAKLCSSLGGDVYESDGNASSDEENETEPESNIDEGVVSDIEDDTLFSTRSSDSGSSEESIDFDADTMTDLAKEGEDTDCDDDEEKENDFGRLSVDLDTTQNKHDISKKFKSSVVDTQFLNLRESEWVADNDILGKGLDSDNDSEGIDLMEDIDSGQSDNEILYDNFFDPPNDVAKRAKKKKKEESHLENEDPLNESENPLTPEPPVSSTQGNKILSKFDEEMMKEEAVKETLVEENYILEKPWAQQGEATKGQRPENSALEEPLEYNIAVSEKPIITECTSQEIEKIILARIKTQLWDDVLRIQKPTIDPSKYKERLVLDEEKSKKDLAKIYEEEFIKRQEKAAEKNNSGESCLLGEKDSEEEPEANKTIRLGLVKLFLQLDTLSNYHFTPKPKRAELKVVTNLSAITLEEATPASVSDANLLAPEEILAPGKGDVKGLKEKTATDKKRERRAKKLHQKRRAHLQEQKLKEKVTKKGKDGVMNQDTSVKYIQKAVKKGQIKLMKGDGNHFKTSISFFNHLEENKKLKRKPEKQTEENKRKKQKTLSSISKVKL